MSMKRYWAKFYWEDWESDPALRLCSLAAQGLWMRMLCIAARADPFGYVTVNGRPLDYKALARLTGETEETVERLLSELDRNGVFSRDRKGRIYSRRMVRDFRKAQTARKNGKKGGNPTLCKNRRKSASDNPRDKPPDKLQDTKMLDTKKDSPSVLPDGSTSPPLENAQARPDGPEGEIHPHSGDRGALTEPRPPGSRKRKTVAARACRFADSRWGGVVPDEWRAWAVENGLPPPAVVREAEKFADYWAAAPGQKGLKRDWAATWRNWVRRALEGGDWPPRGKFDDGGRNDFDEFTGELARIVGSFREGEGGGGAGADPGADACQRLGEEGERGGGADPSAGGAIAALPLRLRVAGH